MLHGLRARFADFAASLPPAPLSRLSSPPPPCICVAIYVGMLCVHGYANILCSCVYGRSPRLSNPSFWATANRRVCPCVRRERKREREREREFVCCVCVSVCVLCVVCVCFRMLYEVLARERRRAMPRVMCGSQRESQASPCSVLAGDSPPASSSPQLPMSPL